MQSYKNNRNVGLIIECNTARICIVGEEEMRDWVSTTQDDRINVTK